MPSATEQYQMLTSIWPKWRAVAASVMPADATAQSAAKQSAIKAIHDLYRFYGRGVPTIMWSEHPRLPRRNHPPLVCHFRESLIYSVWHKLADPGWLCSQIGYDRRGNTFRLPANKGATLGAYLPRVSRFENAISQCDVDALAILELAGQMYRIDARTKKLAKIIERIVNTCFAAVTFEDLCIIVEKPVHVSFNDALQLSAQGTSAIGWSSNYALHAINGQVIGVNEAPNLEKIIYVNHNQRPLMIEYFGWEYFLERALLRHSIYGVSATKLSQDKYGTLYRIRLADQEILVVRVTNRTPEPDGSYRKYVIPVDPACRPLPHFNKPHERLGQPQMLTPLNAVASTFYMTGEEYKAMLGGES